MKYIIKGQDKAEPTCELELMPITTGVALVANGIKILKFADDGKIYCYEDGMIFKTGLHHSGGKVDVT